MTALCWGCAVGVNSVGAPAKDPVGVCWECHVFGCVGHGERDADSGKWLCYPSVATSAAASAGVPELASQTRFRTAEEVAQRFPRIVEAAGSSWTPADAAGIFQMRVGRSPSGIDFELLAVAVNIGQYLLMSRNPIGAGVDARTGHVLPRVLIVMLGAE